MKQLRWWLLLAGTMVMAASVLAQHQWPVHRGGPMQWGVTLDSSGNPVAGDGPAAGYPTWWWPLQSSVGTTISIDIDQLPSVNRNVAYAGNWINPVQADRAVGYLGEGYAYTTCVAAGSVEQPDSGYTAWVSWDFQPDKDGLYGLFVQYPSGGTHAQGSNPGNGPILPMALDGVYIVQWTYAGVRQSRTYVEVNTNGGGWQRIGNGALFPAGPGAGKDVSIKLVNTVPLVYDKDGNPVLVDSPPSHYIVCADGMKLMAAPASASSAPVVAQVAGQQCIIVSRNAAVQDPSDPGGSRASSVGQVVCLKPADTTNPAMPLWMWNPASQANQNIIVEGDPASTVNNTKFVPTSWSRRQGADLPPDAYDGFSWQNQTQNTSQKNPTSCRFEYTPPGSGYYDVYVWYPAPFNGTLNTQDANYIVDYYDPVKKATQEYISGVNQEQNTGQWVRLGTHSWPFDPTLSDKLVVEVSDYSASPGQGTRYTQASAVMFVTAYSGSISVTPAVYTVNVKHDASSAAVPTQVIFVADESGYLYMLDATGDGAGHTWAYWAYPSIPNNNDPNWKDPNKNLDKGQPKPLGYQTTTVAVDSTLNAVFIGAVAGGILSLDCAGRGDLNQAKGVIGTTSRRWTYTDKNAATGEEILNVASAPVYHNGTLYVASTQTRIYALDGAGNGDRTTSVKWIWPNRQINPTDVEDPPASWVQGTIAYVPSAAGDMIVFGTWNNYATFSNTVTSRIIAIDAAGGGNNHTSLRWQYPNPSDANARTLGSMGYGGPLYVPKALVTGATSDMIYVATEDGYMYAFKPDGTLGWDIKTAPAFSAFLGGGVTSPPVLATVNDSGGNPKSCVVVGTSDAGIVAINALDGTGVWAQQINDGSKMFASAAVAETFLYTFTTSGEVIAFSPNQARTDYDPGYGLPATQVNPPGQPSADIEGANAKRIDRKDYNDLSNWPSSSTTAPDFAHMNTPPSRELEWGDMVYIVLYDFSASGGSTSFQVRGPSSSQRFTVPVRTVPPYAGDKTGFPGPYTSFAIYAFLVKGTGSMPATPGDQYNFDAFIQPSGGGTFGPFSVSNLASAGIRHPLAIWNGLGDPTNNGNPGEVGWQASPQSGQNEWIHNGDSKLDPISQQGKDALTPQIPHGQAGSGVFQVADRSLLWYTTGRTLEAVAAVRDDLLFNATGDRNIVLYKKLPWETPPIGFPNPSPDYPDIDRRLENITGLYGTTTPNLLTETMRLNAPTGGDPKDDYAQRVLVGTPVRIDTQVPMFQPANLAPGYVGKVWVYVDMNGDGKMNGVTNSVSTDIVTTGAEPYRTLHTQFFVPPDEKLVVTELTIDLGQSPGGRGFTPALPRSSQSQYYPVGWLSNGGWDVKKDFGTFTVTSWSNVNMLNLRVASQYVPGGTGPGTGRNMTPVPFMADGVSSASWLGADQTLVTDLDPRFGTAFGTPDTGYTVTLHKPRPGDRSPTTLLLPDAPYGKLSNNPQSPMLSVAVPNGQPVGTYSATIRVFEDANRDMALAYNPATGEFLETVSDPSPTVRFTVEGTRTTNAFDQGGLPQFDNPDAATRAAQFRTANISPTAFRSLASGNLYFAFASQRTDPTNTTGASGAIPWAIYTGAMKQGAQPNPGSVAPPLWDLFGWSAGSSNNGSQWWQLGGGPYGSAADFTGTPDPPIAGTAQFYDPAFPVNSSQVNQPPYLFWQGEVKKTSAGGRIVTEYATFYGPVNQNGAVTNINRIVYDDPYMPRFGVKVLLMPGGKAAKMFWYAGTTGRYNLFVSETSDISQPAKWTDPTTIYVPKALVSMQNPCPVLLDNNSIDIVFSGVTKDRKTNEIFRMTFANGSGPRNWQRPKAFGIPASASFDKRAGNVWRSNSALDFVVDNDGKNMNVQVTNVSGASVTANVTGTQVRDANTGFVRWQSTRGGYVVFDPSAGTVTFPTMPPGAAEAVGIVGSARVFRVTPLSNVGGNTEPSSFYDTQPIPDMRYTFDSSGQLVGPSRTGTIVPVDRYWNFYKRGATSAVSPTTVYFAPMRIGFGLPYGWSGNLTLSPHPSSYYTVDPGYAVGPYTAAVYFTTADIGTGFTVTYTDAAGKSQSVQMTAGWIPERPEAAVPMKSGAIAEGQVCAFQDPYVSVAGRPDMAWIFWASSRNGASDIFYETLSPQFYPIFGQ